MFWIHQANSNQKKVGFSKHLFRKELIKSLQILKGMTTLAENMVHRNIRCVFRCCDGKSIPEFPEKNWGFFLIRYNQLSLYCWGPRNIFLNTSSVISSQSFLSSARNHPVEQIVFMMWFENLFHGHTSWQISHNRKPSSETFHQTEVRISSLVQSWNKKCICCHQQPAAEWLPE